MPKENIAQGAAIAAVFFVALIVVSIITVKISDLILDSKVGALDRTLGFIFGAARGLILAVVAFAFYGWLAPEANQPEWVKNARMKPILEAGGEKLRDLVPQDVDALIANLKPKKAAPVNEEPAAETEGDNDKPAADKKTEASPQDAAPAQSAGAKSVARISSNSLLSGAKPATKTR